MGSMPRGENYSMYQSSIGYDLSRVSMYLTLHETLSVAFCIYAKRSTRKSPMREKCTSLKWRLTARKREHDQLSPVHKVERQQVCSTVQFDILRGLHS